MRCSQCCELFFCDRECMRRSWRVHKRICKGPREWVAVEMAIERMLAELSRDPPVPKSATCYICLERGGDLRRHCA